jgi:MtN3 and saliva related transmembrane protein
MLALVAGSFGIAMGLSPLLQLRRVRRRRSSADVSLAYLAVLLVGFALWLSYGIALGNAALIVSNVVALTTNVLTIAAVLRFRETG